jgi:hypothetical protein
MGPVEGTGRGRVANYRGGSSFGQPGGLGGRLVALGRHDLRTRSVVPARVWSFDLDGVESDLVGSPLNRVRTESSGLTYGRVRRGAPGRQREYAHNC